MDKRDGFTLVELVVIILILAIVSAFVLPKFYNLNDYQNRTDYDEVASALRYAQKLAVGSGCDVQVVLAGNNYALQQHQIDCTNGPFVNIAGHPINNGNVSSTIIPSSLTLIFSPMGRSSADANITVGPRTIQVIAETGTVDAQ